jgi:hypothetical protein
MEPHIAENGLTLVVVSSDGEWIWYDERDYQLTARMTRHWSDDAKKQRTWVIQGYWYFGNQRPIYSLHGVRIGGVDADAWIDRNVRGIGHHARINRVVYLEILDEEKVRLSMAEAGSPSKVLEVRDFPR